MRELGPTDRWTTTPRGSVTPGLVRPKSSRLVYRPSVQDLSEQAARNPANSYQEETILSVVNTCTPRASRPGSETYSDRYSIITPSVSQYSADDVIKTSSTTPLCFHQQNNDYHEDLHRQRVLVSAHHRRKLHSIRRTQSMPGSGKRAIGTTDIGHSNQSSPETNEDDANKLELVVTNSTKIDDKELKERINYKLAHRAKLKSAHGTLMATGAPIPGSMIGYNQHITQNHPKYSLRYMNWLTNGLKVQSVRAQPLRRFCHSRPRPPPVPFLNRPKTTINGHFPRKRGTGTVDFNIVGIHKEVLNAETQSNASSYKNGVRDQPELLLE